MSRNRLRGVTLPELAMWMFLTAAVVVVAVPVWFSKQIQTQHEGAVTTLRRIAAAQERFFERSGGTTYGLLGELLGEDPPPKGVSTGGAVLHLEGMEREGEVWSRNGYHYLLYLADRRGLPVLHRTRPPHQEDPDFWVAYAWPDTYGSTGRRLFAADPWGNVWSLENAVGTIQGPQARPEPALLAARIPDDSMPFKVQGAFLERLRWERVDHP